MTRNAIKVIAVLLIAILTVATLSQTVAAAEVGGEETPAASGTVTQKDSVSVTQFENKSDTSGASSSLQNIIGAIITIVQIIGTGVAIIMLIVLAIKYISAAPGDKADIKKHAVVYVVGAIVLFAASGILGIVKNFASNISATSK